MDLIAIIVFLAVILLAMINAKIYNIIHGFISLFGISVFLSFISFAMGKFPSFSSVAGKLKSATSVVSSSLVEPLSDFFDLLKLDFIADVNEIWFYLVTLFIWILSSVLAIMVRKIRRNRD